MYVALQKLFASYYEYDPSLKTLPEPKKIDVDDNWLHLLEAKSVREQAVHETPATYTPNHVNCNS